MKENEIEVSKDELRETMYIQRRIYENEEKHLLKEHLLLATKRVLDARDLKAKLPEDNKELIDLVEMQYLKSFSDLMDVVYCLINDFPYCYLFDNEIEKEDYIVLELEDMVLVNGFIRELKPYNSDSIDIDTIFMALNESIFDYMNHIENDEDYSKGFDKKEFIQITEDEVEEDE